VWPPGSSSYVGLGANGAGAAATTEGAAVSGVARVWSSSRNLFTAAGREVLLVPDTPELAAWLGKREEYRASKFNLIGPPGQPDVVKQRARRTLGYGTGEFEFKNVTPGDYLVLFDTGPKESIARTKVTVPPGETRVEAVIVGDPAMHR
jgi:hypothetical protein